MKNKPTLLPIGLFLFPIICLASVAICGEGNDNNSNGIMLMYKQQQMGYINMILDVERDNARLEEESMDLFVRYMGNRGDRYYKDKSSIDNRKSDNRNRISDLELRKNELKLKIINKDGSIPEWWNENDIYLTNERRQVREDGIRAGTQKLKKGMERMEKRY